MKKDLKEKVQLAQKCENLTDSIDTNVVEPIAMLFSKLFINLNICPNAITIMSMISGILGGIFFLFDSIYFCIIGILLVFLSAIFDTSDGQVARLTNKKSEFGRLLDGIADGLVYVSIYACICINLMGKNIPFTSVKWGGYIWIVGIVCGLYFHTAQARVVDYIRQLHMFFLRNERGNDLSFSKDVQKEYRAIKGFSLKKFRIMFYYFYTKLQEITMPNTQKLLSIVYDNGKEFPDEVGRDFVEYSSKVIRKANLLNFNLRTIVLFILLILDKLLFSGLVAFIFLFILLILEPISFYLIRKYEKIAKIILQKHYVNSVGKK